MNLADLVRDAAASDPDRLPEGVEPGYDGMEIEFRNDFER